MIFSYVFLNTSVAQSEESTRHLYKIAPLQIQFLR